MRLNCFYFHDKIIQCVSDYEPKPNFALNIFLLGLVVHVLS